MFVLRTQIVYLIIAIILNVLKGFQSQEIKLIMKISAAQVIAIQMTFALMLTLVLLVLNIQTADLKIVIVQFVNEDSLSLVKL